MKHTHFENFLAQAVQEEPANGTGLSLDELYGVYTSWCLLNGQEVETPEVLWEALRSRNVDPKRNHLMMKGPAAADYILASAPSIV